MSTKPRKFFYQTLKGFEVDLTIVRPWMKVTTVLPDPEQREKFAKALTHASGGRTTFRVSALDHMKIRDVARTLSVLPGYETKKGRPL